MIVPLNTEQEAAAEAIQGNTVVKASPGSGKTTVLVNRYLRMISTHRINPADILNLTFTAEAAQNMANRTGLSKAKETFRTFHSLALDIVTKEKNRLPFRVGDFVLPSNGQEFQLLKDLMKTYPAVTSFRSLRDKITEWKCKNVLPEQAMEDMYYDKRGGFFYASAYRDYERKCREQGWLDFSSLMDETVKLLEVNSDLRAKYQKRYIAVDEAQDTDVVQEKLLRLLYGGNIFFVGDSNQLVYEWRSAQAGNLDKFAKDYNAKVLYLGQNYRSTPEIVSLLKVILPVDNGVASYMLSKRPVGSKPTLVKYESDLHEAEGIIKKLTDLNNTAVIARTNRQLRTFQRACAQQNVRTMILGQKDLWQTNEVKHLLTLTKEHKGSSRLAHEVMAELVTQHNMMHTYRNTGGPNEKPPVENLADIIKLSVNRGTVKEFLDWLRRLTFACEAAKAPGYEHKDKNPTLALSTVHMAKGKEWKNVFVIGCKQGLMPHKDGEINEEKRIFFVAASRAADMLQISYDGPRSEFLQGLEDVITFSNESEGVSKPDLLPSRAVQATKSKASAAELALGLG